MLIAYLQYKAAPSRRWRSPSIVRPPYNRWLARAVNFPAQGQQLCHDVTQPARRMERGTAERWSQGWLCSSLGLGQAVIGGPGVQQLCLRLLWSDNQCLSISMKESIFRGPVGGERVLQGTSVRDSVQCEMAAKVTSFHAWETGHSRFLVFPETLVNSLSVLMTEKYKQKPCCLIKNTFHWQKNVFLISHQIICATSSAATWLCFTVYSMS